MPDGNPSSPPLGDGLAAIQSRLPGPSPAALRAIPDQTVPDAKAKATGRYRRRVVLVLVGLLVAPI